MSIPPSPARRALLRGGAALALAAWAPWLHAAPRRDITVLTLHRGTAVIPNPGDRHVLEAEDPLLCFGRLEEMRSMVPERPKRRTRVKKLPKHPIHDS